MFQIETLDKTLKDFYGSFFKYSKKLHNLSNTRLITFLLKNRIFNSLKGMTCHFMFLLMY